MYREKQLRSVCGAVFTKQLFSYYKISTTNLVKLYAPGMVGPELVFDDDWLVSSSVSSSSSYCFC